MHNTTFWIQNLVLNGMFKLVNVKQTTLQSHIHVKLSINYAKQKCLTYIMICSLKEKVKHFNSNY